MFISRDKPILLKLNNGLKFYFHTLSETQVAHEVFVDKVYDIRLENPKVIVDIGAHIGLTSLFFADKYENSKVYAYEPSSDSYRRLKNNIKLNRLENIIPYKYAVNDKAGEKVFLYKRVQSPMNSLNNVANKDQIIDKEKVKTTNIKEILKVNKIKKIDLLKVDCEGCEYKIILNMNAGIVKKIDTLVVEYHDFLKVNDHKKLLSKLMTLNYNIRLFNSSNEPSTGVIYAYKKPS